MGMKRAGKRSKRTSKFGSCVDTDALPRRKDVRKWKLMGNRGIEVKERERERCLYLHLSIYSGET